MKITHKFRLDITGNPTIDRENTLSELLLCFTAITIEANKLGLEEEKISTFSVKSLPGRANNLEFELFFETV